jgi:hypothetical protein
MLSKYTIVSGVVFGAVALVQLVRAVNQWSVQIGSFNVPVWASWIAAVFAGSLCIWAFKSAQK